MSLEGIISIILLIDSIGAVFMSWFGSNWYLHHARIFSRYFPIAKGWTLLYFVLMLWIASLVNKLGGF